MQIDGSKREERALDALIAASLRLVDSGREVTEDEIRPFIEGEVQLQPEDERAIEMLGTNVIENITRGQCSGSHAKDCDAGDIEDLSPLCVAMNRKNAQNKLDEVTRKEIERKRRELLGDKGAADDTRGKNSER